MNVPELDVAPSSRKHPAGIPGRLVRALRARWWTRAAPGAVITVAAPGHVRNSISVPVPTPACLSGAHTGGTGQTCCTGWTYWTGQTGRRTAAR
jgi:hypothetical protein